MVGEDVGVGVTVGGGGVIVGGRGVAVSVMVGERVIVGGNAVFVGVGNTETGSPLHDEDRNKNNPIMINRECLYCDFIGQPPCIHPYQRDIVPSSSFLCLQKYFPKLF
jgi:hypothetical protein